MEGEGPHTETNSGVADVVVFVGVPCAVLPADAALVPTGNVV